MFWPKTCITWIMRMLLFVCLFLLLFPVYGQVDEIKQKSEEHARQTHRTKSGDGNGGDGEGFFLFDLMFRGIPMWQQYKLSADRTRYPSLVSVELFAQGAANPPGYYFLWPRMRGNWGIFSTDFRMNYLLEQTSDGSFIHIRTNDWQVLQLNLITSRYLTLRLGNGMMNEAFGGRNSFYEWSVQLGVHNSMQKRMVWIEYRHAHDFSSGAWPRLELSAQYQHGVIEYGAFRALLSAGVVYQNYYRSVPVFGMQGGIVFRFY
ncbi:MAG: hypothetical protein KatS3mg032_0299 [Cyclobacteriaceae bacterium]|nr:MAG: hypothetical protein KatS3mg032_0299 [Cyclobacteriaceae bacterium]